MLQAAALLAERGKAFELWIAGDGPERGRLERLAAELGVADRVRFLGEVPDAHELLAEAHILAHAARSEGLSNAILEAMAEGVPVVATPVGATPELIEHEVSGLLTAWDVRSRWPTPWRRLLDDPDCGGGWEKRGCGESARRAAKSTSLRRYEEIFASMLASPLSEEACGE